MPVIIKPRAALTRITATTPTVVTKEFWLNPDEILKKTTTAHVSAGTMETVHVANLQEFSKLLQALSTNQCLSYGITGRDKVRLTTEKAWAAAGRPDDARPRSIKHMYWSSQPGILMLDYDPPKDGKPLSREELVASLVAACPGLQAVEMLWWASTSSCIYHGEKELSGIRGQRLYIMVKNATDIPRLGHAINTYLWAMGIGEFAVSKSGSLLERGQFDGSVWQSNRIDFAAGAKCHDGLEQRRGAPMLIAGKVGVVDSLVAVPDPSPEVIAAAEANKTKAKAEKREEAGKVRLEWVASRVAKLIIKAPDMHNDHAEATVKRAVEHRVLMGDWQVMVVYGDAVQAFSVSHILDNPNEFHGLETLDPLEPDYDNGRAVGMLFLLGTNQRLYSFAHGGANFRLVRQPTSVEVVKGKIFDTTNMAMGVLRKDPNIFDFGSGIVSLSDNGMLEPLDGNSLSYTLSGIAQFCTSRISKKSVVICFIDPPPNVCQNILSLRTKRNLKKLVAVITAPTLRPDGTVLSTLGFDAATGLYLDATDDLLSIPDKPTKEQAKAALDRLWKPFAKFPFASPLDRAVFLSATLTAVVRAALGTAPGFGFDAPTQSSGKTLLARCIAILMTGSEPGTLPPTRGGSDEEMRKRLFGILWAGKRVIFLDNILGVFDSASMASLLTSETYSDRVLSRSEVPIVPNRALVLFSGNNLTFADDMSRRVLVCRIDPQTDKPFARKFDINPAAYCLEHRQQLVADALTLIRFYLSSGVPQLGAGRMGSFEAWDAWVRQTVLYVDRELATGVFGDVMEQVIANQAADPEQESLGQLLHAWNKLFGSNWLLPSSIMDVYGKVFPYVKSDAGHVEEVLAHAVNDLHAGHKELTTKGLGRLLKYRKGRIVGGLRLEQSKVGNDTSRWRVVEFKEGAKK